MYLGIDLGTSELKLLLLDDTHHLRGSASAPLTVQRPQPLWSEQQPAAWWQALLQAAAALRERNAKDWAAVRAIGLAGQMHGAVLLDASQQVLRPAILWNDGRSSAECAQLEWRMPALSARAGNRPMPGFTAPKLVWVAAHEPDVFSRVAKVLLPKDYLRLLLTGEFASDPSDAAGTLWLDVAQRRGDAEVLDACSLGIDQMPALVDGCAVSGTLRPAAAAALGLPSGIAVAGGAGDNAASAVGMGAVQPGQGFVSLGTSGVLFVVTDRLRANPAAAVHAFCHTLPQRWHQMAVMLSAASALSWLTQRLQHDSEASLLAGLAAWDAAAQPLPAQAAAPIFLPYLNGERTPHNDVHARAVLFGLDAGHDATDLAYAVIEGVTFGMADGLQALRQAGTAVDALALVGGGARSAVWAQLHADVLGLPIDTLQGGQTGAALGAARLAWMADGATEAQVCTAPPRLHRYEPRPSRQPLLSERLARYRALYPALQPLYAR